VVPRETGGGREGCLAYNPGFFSGDCHAPVRPFILGVPLPHPIRGL